MHSHLIPGVDDGVKDVETSLELIKGLKELGYKKIITTPHVLWDIYPNTNEIIAQGIEELKAAVAKEGLNIELYAAAEYFIDEHFEEAIKKRSPLLCISKNMVLVEFSMLTAPYDLQTVIFELQMQDYIPVLAHPERYVYLGRNKQVFEDLRIAGCLFQLNLLSVTGYYGRTVQDLAEYLIRNEYYDFAGTDMHHEHHLKALQKLSSSPLYQKLKESSLLRNSAL
jgi:tyrosine-protein phosphatase YwqE